MTDEPRGRELNLHVHQGEKYASQYDGDERQDVKTDVLNAYYHAMHFGRAPLLARIAELEKQVAAANGKINVFVDILRDVLMPLSVSKMDAMTSGEEDDYQMIAELEKRIKAAIHGATP